MYCSGRCRLRLPTRHALCPRFGHFVVLHFEYAGYVGFFEHFKSSSCGHLCSSYVRRSPCCSGRCLHRLDALRPVIKQCHHIRYRYRYTYGSDRNQHRRDFTHCLPRWSRQPRNGRQAPCFGRWYRCIGLLGLKLWGLMIGWWRGYSDSIFLRHCICDMIWVSCIEKGNCLR